MDHEARRLYRKITHLKNYSLNSAIALACLFVYLSAEDRPVFANLALAGMSTAIITMFTDLALREDIIAQMSKLINLQKGVEEVGLVEVHTARKALDLQQKIRDAKSEITLLSVTAAGFIQDHIDELKDAASRGVTLKIIICNAQNVNLESRARARGSYTTDKFTTEINETIFAFKELREYVSVQRKGEGRTTEPKNIDLLTYSSYPICAIYKFDSTFYYAPYLNGSGGINSPVFAADASARAPAKGLGSVLLKHLKSITDAETTRSV